MRRRDFLAGITGSAAAWPLVTHAQQPAVPVIGFLTGGTVTLMAPFVAAFREGLKVLDYIDGQNVTIVIQGADGNYGRLPELLNDLIQNYHIALLIAPSSEVALAAKAAATTVPIIFSVGGDPIKLGLVTSMNRPSGNATGIAQYTGLLGRKRVGLLHELVPRATTVAVLVNPQAAIGEIQYEDVREAASSLGLQTRLVNASNEGELNAAFVLAQNQGTALIVTADTFFLNYRKQIAALATRHVTPALYPTRQFVEVGGLMSYAPDLANAYREAGVYAGRILNGMKPADLPVVQPTRFELVINLKIAKELGLEIPATLLALADEVIE
jgi:putative ABC transport system substrate-binding protein